MSSYVKFKTWEPLFCYQNKAEINNMPSNPKHSHSVDGNDDNPLDSANPGSDLNPVFGGDVQPQEINDKKIMGAPDPMKPDQAEATKTVDTHPVFGNNAQPQDVYHEKIVGAADTEEEPTS
jgi:hypothetical protein